MYLTIRLASSGAFFYHQNNTNHEKNFTIILSGSVCVMPSVLQQERGSNRATS
ncbi:hypothetical protein IMPR6_230070 [Imperialibacter sp. EC-SDR9]|nr:hypothetical protein IMPERIA89_80095 [Imperialibacter sp. 89]CAD5299988.1 hypothetical protein IMPERIA75_90094 [Imperialibacter sp. 75]VVT15485.1 hypothetical protein IMPR6_230070 [Imperialibacter sp. EC-SDR9]